MTSPDSTAPLIGLIVPPASGEVPSDAAKLYPHRARFIARGLALPAISTAGYDSVIDTVTARAIELADAGAQVISLMGTSLSFYRGANFNRELVRAMTTATGLPATTMSQAVVRGLRNVGARRIAVATAYTDDVNARLRDFLLAEGFEVRSISGLGMTDVIGVGEVTGDTLMAIARDAFAKDPTAQAILISCGGLKTLGIIEALEAQFGVPVVSSSPAGFWDVVQLANVDPLVSGAGRLFRQRAPAVESH
ncbi:arylmalonate decarboxylase [Paraburkholderia susongensis]|uniref:Arylmalonate decarboxylase n=1 Tax=Paraburkholderia susongensis TaxID=1515439 RepID=A0A1X7HYE2_9BURK|nr:aspartate/glutamate racemase family protein [Paraburkholderia susongensis]SMG06708.1 arylmalonate decarboxylase [Paraburkholderia susongensis]